MWGRWSVGGAWTGSLFRGGDGSLWKEETQQGFWGEAGFLGHTVCQM